MNYATKDITRLWRVLLKLRMKVCRIGTPSDIPRLNLRPGGRG